jgi:hypothetical protein
MEKYVDPTKITFKSNKKEMEKFFFFHYSKEKSSYVCSQGVHHRCRKKQEAKGVVIDMPCDIDHPYYWSNMPFKDHFNNLDLRNDENAIGCFGCSFTFGAFIKLEDTWPFILQEKTNLNCLNFGTLGAGIDSIYLNLKASAVDYKFKKVKILLPGFDRRLARIKHLDYWLKWPVVPTMPITWNQLLPDPIHKELRLDEQKLKAHGENVIRKIVKDRHNKYEKKIINKLIRFCEKTYDEFYITSWSTEVYDFLTSNFKDNTTAFYNHIGPKTLNDHPTRVQNSNFVNSII